MRRLKASAGVPAHTCLSDADDPLLCPAPCLPVCFGACKKQLHNIVHDGGPCVAASAAPARRLLSSRATPYVNVTYDFDTFASLSLPTTVAVRLTLPPHACTP